MRINDEITRKMKIVDCISTYISNLHILRDIWCEENQFMVYRGETEEYSTPCIPTIYRGFALNQNKNYEINMFMAMRQNNISKSEDYLHNAIDAQHDGFPSRLLDVTYNSLIALYFAVTPYYFKSEVSMDGKDGMVYVFKYDEAYSPESPNTQMMYKNALSGSEQITNDSFFAHHHILIDHCKQNKRIIAQQGAFILFTGESPEPIPHYQMCGIRIDKNAKAAIREELKSLFGIYTGSVYPEVELMQDEIKERCMRINSLDVDVQLMTKYTLNDFSAEYDYFVDCCDYYNSKGNTPGELIRIIEKTVALHKEHLKSYWNRLKCIENDKENSRTRLEMKSDNLLSMYNELLNGFNENLPDSVSELIDSEIIGPLGGKDEQNTEEVSD